MLSVINWERILTLKHVAKDDYDSLSHREKLELKEADDILKVAKLSDRNLLKPGPMVKFKRLYNLSLHLQHADHSSLGRD